MQWLKSRRLQFLLGGTALLFLLFAVLRIVFVLLFSSIEPFEIEPRADFWGSVLIGLRFDLRLAILGMLPLAFLCYLPWINPVASRLGRYLARAYVAMGLLAVLLIYILDFGHYDYLGVRLNATVWRFVGNTDISSTMVWQSYPVVWITLGWLLTATVMFAAFVALERRVLDRPKSNITRLTATAGWVVMIVLSFFGLLGRASDINLKNPVPLRWSDAFFSGNADLGAIGLNPVIFLYDTAWMKVEPYDRELVARYYPQMVDYLGVQNPDPTRLQYHRRLESQSHRIEVEQPNVVFVMLESLGASRVGAYGNPLEATPNLDDIATRGWLFERFFVPVTGTAKTVWASITGTPDVTQQETATRNPLITRQNTIINAFEGYQKLYMLGGSAGWANMSALVRQSLDGVTLYEEGDWEGPNVDVWGISDLQLFKETDRILRSLPKEKPFFAYIQTSGNHRPFTIPEDRGDFKVMHPPEEKLREYGFTGADQYNAVRFLDYSIGRFLDMARESGYHDNTIFVFFGDHGNRITQLPHMAPIYEQMWLESNHVPHMIYAPELLKPRVIPEAASLVDMLPTVSGLIGVDYETRTLGRDFQLSEGRNRAVPVVLVEGPFPIIGMVSQDFLLKMNYDGSDATLHAMDSATPKNNIAGEYPVEFKRLSDLARGSYETSRYMLYDNVRD